MSDPKLKVLRDGSGREVVQFVTPSGVKATVSTSIDLALLDKMRIKLERKLVRSGHLPAGPRKR